MMVIVTDAAPYVALNSKAGIDSLFTESHKLCLIEVFNINTIMVTAIKLLAKHSCQTSSPELWLKMALAEYMFTV
jgi:hypothetical protein